MEIHEALYTTRMMRRLRPDPIPLDTQARILDAAVRAPNGGNTQRWHFLVVDEPDLKRELAQLFRQGAPSNTRSSRPVRADGGCRSRRESDSARRDDAPHEGVR